MSWRQWETPECREGFCSSTVTSKSLLQANIWLYGFGVAAAVFQLLVVDGFSAVSLHVCRVAL